MRRLSAEICPLQLLQGERADCNLLACLSTKIFAADPAFGVHCFCRLYTNSIQGKKRTIRKKIANILNIYKISKEDQQTRDVQLASAIPALVVKVKTTRWGSRNMPRVHRHAHTFGHEHVHILRISLRSNDQTNTHNRGTLQSPHRHLVNQYQ